MRSVFALAALAALLVLPAGVARAATNANESTMAREIADDINRERAARHLPSIPVDAQYSSGAQRVAESNRDRPCHACHSTDHPSGEIVWWGSDHPSSGSPIWWMGSPPHRALVLAPTATRLGVGVACNGTEHDAVAWIETSAGATDSSPTPVATKSGTGTRCKGATTSATTAPAVAAVRVTTTTTSRVTPTTRPTTTSGVGRRTTTTTSRQKGARAGPVANNDSSSAVTEVAAAPASPFAVAQPLSARPIASSSKPLAGPTGVGGVGTALLLLTFGGVLALGLVTRRAPR